jgi:hypothetical protein
MVLSGRAWHEEVERKGLLTARLPIVAASDILDPDLYERLPPDGIAAAVANPEFVLVVVLGRDCASCVDVIRKWLAEFDRLVTSRVALTVLWRERPDTASRQWIPVEKTSEEFLISNLERFRAKTGITAYPISLFIDRRKTIRAAVSGLASEEVLHRCRAMIDSPEESTLFYRGVATSPLIIAPPATTPALDSRSGQ